MYAVGFNSEYKYEFHFSRYLFLENIVEDPETEVALNLICVDETTRQTIDFPIRPRSVRDLKNEVHKKQNRSNDVETKIKLRFEKFDSNVKTGMQTTLLHYLKIKFN